jgi:phasin
LQPALDGFINWNLTGAAFGHNPCRCKERIMSDQARDRFENANDMRSMAEASFEQVRKTFEQFAGAAQVAAAGSLEERNATVRAGASDVGSQAIAYAGQNAQASLDHAQSLLKAKDLTEVMRLHGEYVQAQMRALAEQAGEIGRLIGSAAMESTKPKA